MLLFLFAFEIRFHAAAQIGLELITQLRMTLNP